MFDNISNGFRRIASQAAGYFKPAQLPQNVQNQMSQIDYTKYAPMPAGRITNAAKYLAPKRIQAGMAAFENDASQFNAMRHIDSAEATAQRLKQMASDKMHNDFVKAINWFVNKK